MTVTRKLRTKLFILFLVLLLIPIIGTGLYAQFFFSRTYYDNGLEIEQNNVNSIAVHVRNAFIDVESDLIFLSELSGSGTLQPDGTAGISGLSSTMEKDYLAFAQTHSMYQTIAIYDNAGQRLLLVENTDEGAVASQNTAQTSPFVEQVLREPVGSTHFGVESISDQTELKMVFAFRYVNGLIVSSIDTIWILQPDTVDMDGGTWSLQLPNRIVLNFAPEGHERLSPEMQAHDDWLRNSSGYYVTGNRHVFYQNITIPTVNNRYNLALFHTIPSQQLQADLRTYYQTFGSLALGGVLCVIALSMLAIDRFVEPIRFLKNSMDDIRQTQKTPALPQRLPPDEIGELTLAFYGMAAELEAKRTAERALVEKLITAQEEERKRIAYDIHDGLIQLLVGARFYLLESKEICNVMLEDTAQEKYQEGLVLLSSAIVEGRRIMQGLHPSTLDDLGLVEALEELVRDAARLGGWTMDISLDFYEDNQNPDKVLSVTLYRIAQEALNNICKHAEASKVTIKLWDDQGLHLLVADDGIGFDPKVARRSEYGWGLRTMRERINLLHGTIKIDSQTGQGTTIKIWIPQTDIQPKEVQDDSN